MRILGIETSGSIASVALLIDGVLHARRTSETANAHAERLLELTDACLEQASCDRTALERIAVGAGPGSFTGLRVGMSLAQGLGLGLGIDVVGVPSLAAMARAARSASEGRWLCPLIDARRGEVFAAAYTPNGDELWPARTFKRDSIARELSILMAGRRFVALGELAGQLFDAANVLNVAGTSFPSAEFTAQLGAEQQTCGEVVPLYARGADAVLPNLPPNPLTKPIDSV